MQVAQVGCRPSYYLFSEPPSDLHVSSVCTQGLIYVNMSPSPERVCMQTNGAVRPIVRKKAALCLLRLLRKAGPESDMLAPDVWSAKLVSCNLLWVFVQTITAL